MLSNFFSANRAVYEIKSKNASESEGARNDVTIWRIHIACWISKVTCTDANAHTHARTHKYVVFIAFARQQ